MQTRRERLQEATREEIKAVARKQMAERGAAALSLRAIAAEMGLTAPALYRYYASRDDLIAALIVDAFDALGAVLATARAGQATDDYAGQFVAMLIAYRAWALTHRADFTLVYGTPIPGYHAPAAITAPAAGRSLAPLLDLLSEGWVAGVFIVPNDYATAPAPLQEQLVRWAEARVAHPVPAPLLLLGYVAWAHLQGLIMLELFGHIAPVLGDPGPFYELEVRLQLARFGLHSPA